MTALLLIPTAGALFFVLLVWILGRWDGIQGWLTATFTDPVRADQQFVPPLQASVARLPLQSSLGSASGPVPSAPNGEGSGIPKVYYFDFSAKGKR